MPLSDLFADRAALVRSLTCEGLQAVAVLDQIIAVLEDALLGLLVEEAARLGHDSAWVVAERARRLQAARVAKGLVSPAPAEEPPPVRTCRACGCTDATECAGGCGWVGDTDLCTACHERDVNAARYRALEKMAHVERLSARSYLPVCTMLAINGSFADRPDIVTVADYADALRAEAETAPTKE